MRKNFVFVECWVQHWAPEYKTELGILGRAQHRATKIIRGLEHPSCEERL